MNWVRLSPLDVELLDALGGLALAVDAQGRILHWNRACSLLAGYSLDEARGQVFWDLLRCASDTELTRTPTEGPPRRVDTHVVTRTGERRLIAWTWTAIPSPVDGSVTYLATGVDVTDVQSRITRAAHDLRSPLSTILLQVEAMRRRDPDVDPIRLKSREAIWSAAQLIKNLIQEWVTKSAPAGVESAAATSLLDHKDHPQTPATILVAEDERMVRMPLCDALRHQGFEVLEAADGEEAVELVRKHGATIDVLVTDILFPRTSGREIASELHKSHPDVSAIFMSGYSKKIAVDEFRLDPDSLFVQKPICAEELGRLVRDLMGKKAELRSSPVRSD